MELMAADVSSPSTSTTAGRGGARGGRGGPGGEAIPQKEVAQRGRRRWGERVRRPSREDLEIKEPAPPAGREGQRL